MIKMNWKQIKYQFYLLAGVCFTSSYPLLESWVKHRISRTFQSEYYWLVWIFLVVYAVLLGLDSFIVKYIGLNGREALFPRIVAVVVAALLLGIGILQMWGLTFQYLLILIVFLVAKALAERRT